MIIVSSCLAGINCRYSGDSCPSQMVIDLVNSGKAIPLCPEVLGGLNTPRIPCEIIKNKDIVKVINKNGEDKTLEFKLGAEKTLEIAKILGAKKAILKAKSPSCGCGLIYDGTFSGNLIKGKGLTAELLLKNGIEI
ncbi:MAG: DUF523 domain-containing protein, partial [Clostridium sp.]